MRCELGEKSFFFFFNEKSASVLSDRLSRVKWDAHLNEVIEKTTICNYRRDFPPILDELSENILSVFLIAPRSATAPAKSHEREIARGSKRAASWWKKRVEVLQPIRSGGTFISEC